MTWWPVPEREIYEINSAGQVRNKKTGRILKEYRMRLTGVRMVNLCAADGSTLSRSVPKLVRTAEQGVLT